MYYDNMETVVRYQWHYNYAHNNDDIILLNEEHYTITNLQQYFCYISIQVLWLNALKWQLIHYFIPVYFIAKYYVSFKGFTTSAVSRVNCLKFYENLNYLYCQLYLYDIVNFFIKIYEVASWWSINITRHYLFFSYLAK